MSPPEPPRRPITERRAPTEYRGPSESSGTQAPFADPGQAQLAALLAQMEGRLLAATSTAIVDTERRLMIVANGTSRRDVEATQFDLSRVIHRWQRSAAVAALIAALLGGKEATDWVLGRDITEAADVVAVEATRREQASLVERHEAVVAQAEANAKRLDAIEPVLLELAAWVREQKAAPVVPIVVPKRKGAK